MKTIVLSGINLFRGGTLKIMQDCIETISAFAGDDYQIIALVHNAEQYLKYKNVRYISYPKSRKSWFYRLYYEFMGLKKLSKHLKPYIWFSLHDTTPNVVAEKKIMYFHNPFIFSPTKWQYLFIQPDVVIFHLFSRYIIKINIRKNNFVIVQQEWLREAFEKMFNIHNVVVALPEQTKEPIESKFVQCHVLKEKIQFFYPATPLVHKNFDVIFQAVSLLEKEGITNFEVKFTFNGTENSFAKKVVRKYSYLNNLLFAGFLTEEEKNNTYQNYDCLLFTSKIETWGLPISEAKESGMSILVSDLPYAKEAVGKYDKVKFFDPDNARQLADEMKRLIQGTIVYDETMEIQYKGPFTKNWDELIRFLFNE